MNNPFAPQPSPAPTAPNPFAPAPPPPAPPPPAPPPPGVAAIQVAFAQPAAPPANPPATAAPNPFAAPPQSTAFAPLNPPGEAGLGGPPQAPPKMRPDDIVEQPPKIEAPTFTPPAVPPAAAAKRSRKPRAKADAAPTPVGTAVVDGHEVTVYTPACDEDCAMTPPDLSKVSTEDLREALKSRGWTVQLTDG